MLRVGMIGCGHISHKHIKTLAQFNELELIAVSDIKTGRMEEAASLYRSEKGDELVISLYEDYHHLLLDPRIDVVIIAVLSGLHAEIAKLAIKHNKHIIVEKPFALSLNDADEIIHLSRKYNKKVFVCHQLRYRPLLQKIKTLLEQGYFGEPYFGMVSIRLNRSESYYASAAWKGTWDKDGGMLVNQGIHLVDLLVWILGDVRSVYGEISTKVKNKETEDVAAGIITFENQAKGLIEANTITQPENLGYYLSVFGEKGSVCIGGQGFNEVEHCYFDDYPHIEKELRELRNDLNEHYLMYNDFLEAISGAEGQSPCPIMTAEEGRKALEVIFAVYQSSLKKQPIDFPLEEFSTTDMLERDRETGSLSHYEGDCND